MIDILTETDDTSMTPEMCLIHCKTLHSKRYAFLKNKNYCYCAEEIPESMMSKSEDQCTKRCSGEYPAAAAAVAAAAAHRKY